MLSPFDLHETCVLDKQLLGLYLNSQILQPERFQSEGRISTGIIITKPTTFLSVKVYVKRWLGYIKNIADLNYYLLNKESPQTPNFREHA